MKKKILITLLIAILAIALAGVAFGAVWQLSNGQTDGTTLGQSSSDHISLYNVTPVTQPTASVSNTVAGFINGSSHGGPIYNGSTFTGNLGTSRYTIGGIVNALKKLGILAQ